MTAIPTEHAVVLDTDIGSDVDDAQALGVLLGDPHVTLVGCTTVYGDTVLRARLARRLCRLSGRPVPPVVPGSRETLGHLPVWWAGHEGVGFPDLETETVDDDVDAVELLIRSAASRPGGLDVVAIGPLTNVALALSAEPSLVTSLRHLYLMGGRFDDPQGDHPPEHNFKCDPEAAAAVFASGIPLTVIGLEITGQVRLEEADVQQFSGRGRFGEALAAEIARWWSFTGSRANVPHDGLAVLTMLTPELFGFEQRSIRIEDSGPSAGRCLFDEYHGRPVRVVTSVDADAARYALVKRMAAAQA